MHEMGIANSVLEAVRNEMRRYPDKFPCKVGVRVGAMVAIDQDSLRFCFDAMILETELDKLELGIEVSPLRLRCQSCGQEFEVRDYNSRCPHCGGLEARCVSGDELELAYLEMEEYGPNTVRTEGSQRE